MTQQLAPPANWRHPDAEKDAILRAIIRAEDAETYLEKANDQAREAWAALAATINLPPAHGNLSIMEKAKRRVAEIEVLATRVVNTQLEALKGADHA